MRWSSGTWKTDDLRAPREVFSQSAKRLGATFEGVFAVETIERPLHESYGQLAATSQNLDHLQLTERFAADRLQDGPQNW